MILGFDLDGTLCDVDVTVLHFMHKLSPEEEALAEIYYYTERKPILDPHMFMCKGDVYHIITGRHEDLTQITMDWCQRFYPDAKSVNIVGGTPWYKNKNKEEWASWTERSIKRKADKIRKLGCEIFFEDSVRNVIMLREILPEVKIVQVGGRLR